MKLRATLQNFFANHEMGWEVFMIVLAIIFVAIGFLPDMVNFSAGGADLLDNVDLGITLFFAVEFVARISIASSRKTYLKGHWLDLIAIFPVARWLRIARIARIVRLLRLIRLVRVLNSLERLGLSIARFGKLNGLQWTMLALTVVMLTASWLLYMFEHAVNPKITSYWDALYASLVTWTTPGYGEIIPMTANGRIVGLVLIISGLLAWGMFIANLAAFLADRRKKSCDPVVEELQTRLSRIDELNKRELVVLNGAINALIADHVTQLKDK